MSRELHRLLRVSDVIVRYVAAPDSPQPPLNLPARVPATRLPAEMSRVARRPSGA